MRQASRFLFPLSGAILVVALGGLLVPRILRPGALGAEVSVLLRALFEESVRSDALVTRDQQLLRCLDAKRDTITELIAGKITLHQAVERFREISSLLDDGQDSLLGAQPRLADREALLANVLKWARHQLQSHPQGDEILARLRAEAVGYRLARGRQG